MAIYPEDLDAWEKMAGIHVGSGDVVFIRTGRWARRAAKGPWNAGQQGAGLYATCAKWLHQRDVAIVGSDLGTDVAPSGIAGGRRKSMPLQSVTPCYADRGPDPSPSRQHFHPKVPRVA